MAARNKKKARRAATDREPDIQDIFALHLTASQEIQHRLTALETEVRLSGRDPKSP